MTGHPTTAPALTALALLLVAGCLGSAPGPRAAPDGLVPGESLLVTSGGGPVPFAQAVAYRGGERAAVLSASAEGILRVAGLDAVADRLAVWAPGTESASLSTSALPPRVELSVGDAPPPDSAAFLRFLPPVPMPCDDPVWRAKQVVVRDLANAMDLCGGGEPILEISSEGTIWLSSTVILASAPPIWVSRDGGETFTLFRGAGTGIVREATGTEVDLALDAAGNLYALDENFAINWFTSWAPDGTHRWSTPLPLVPKTHDRPWVRARDADEVVIVYSDQHLRPRTSYLFRSADGGLTWGPTPEYEWPCAQMLGQGKDPSHLMLAADLGCDGTAGNLRFSEIQYRESRDFGRTWTPMELAPVPQGEFDYRAMWVILNPVADDDGNVYLAYSHAIRKDAREIDIHLVRRDPEGLWHGPFRLGFSGTNVLPWISAGRAGHVGLSWYHTDALAYRADQAEAEWFAFGAYSVDMDTDAPHFLAARADARPVFTGPGMHVDGEGESMAFGRTGEFLADFTASEFTPDGRLALAYSRSEQNSHFFSRPHFVQSAERLDLVSAPYWNGPR